MATFKLSIADPKSGKTYKKEVKDEDAKPFIGMNIGQQVKGEVLGMTGYELAITGGSDYCGFPMRRGILGLRKKVNLLGGVGFNSKRKGMHKRKTVCGHKIHDKISQINLKVTKQGSKNMEAEFGGEAPKEEKSEPKPEPKKESKPAEQKAPEKQDSPKEDAKPVEKKSEAPKKEEPKQEK